MLGERKAPVTNWHAVERKTTTGTPIRPLIVSIWPWNADSVTLTRWLGTGLTLLCASDCPCSRARLRSELRRKKLSHRNLLRPHLSRRTSSFLLPNSAPLVFPFSGSRCLLFGLHLRLTIVQREGRPTAGEAEDQPPSGFSLARCSLFLFLCFSLSLDSVWMNEEIPLTSFSILLLTEDWIFLNCHLVPPFQLSIFAFKSFSFWSYSILFSCLFLVLYLSAVLICPLELFRLLQVLLNPWSSDSAHFCPKTSPFCPFVPILLLSSILQYFLQMNTKSGQSKLHLINLIPAKVTLLWTHQLPHTKTLLVPSKQQFT